MTLPWHAPSSAVHDAARLLAAIGRSSKVDMYSGAFVLPWYGYVLITLGLTHMTIAAVTIYLHRHSAHRAVALHPLVSHFFRFWLWLTTGMQTRQWTAVHRKHHARCETREDPHSPQVLGIAKLLWDGTDVYKTAAADRNTLDRFGQGTPNDWIERHIYSHYPVGGIGLMMVLDFALFGFLGLTIWVVQMAWIPFFAAGVINGVGHYWGYRSYQPKDASRNIVPWGILIGGEELHNNHHAYPSSARLSRKWWEIDLGWAYIRILAALGLAQVKKTAPYVKLASASRTCDEHTLEAVVLSRYDVLAAYTRSIKGTCAHEIAMLRSQSVNIEWCVVKKWLRNGEPGLSVADQHHLKIALLRSKVLQLIHTLRAELPALWERTDCTKDQLVRHLTDWCHRAEASGIRSLYDFSTRLRRYQL